MWVMGWRQRGHVSQQCRKVHPLVHQAGGKGGSWQVLSWCGGEQCGAMGMAGISL